MSTTDTEKAEVEPFIGRVSPKESILRSFCNKRSYLARHEWARQWIRTVATHGVTVLATLLVVYLYSWIKSPEATTIPRGTLYSPLAPAVKYDVYTPTREFWDNSTYMGEPSHESDRAWVELMHPHGRRSFLLHPHEALKLNLTEGLTLPTGDYVTLMGVTHNLHCLRRLHQSRYESYYYGNITAKQRQENWLHDAHCLENLRTSVMCYPDTTLYPFYKSHRQGHNLTPRADAIRECVNWDSLQDFVLQRRFDRLGILEEEGVEIP